LRMTVREVRPDAVHLDVMTLVVKSVFRVKNLLQPCNQRQKKKKQKAIADRERGIGGLPIEQTQ